MTVKTPEWLTPGAVLAAADVLRSRPAAFSPDQVAHLIAIAYDTGRQHGIDEALERVFGALKEALGGDADGTMRDAVNVHLRVRAAREARAERDGRVAA